MSESENTTQPTQEVEEQTQVPQSVDPFTVLFNAVEIANRRGAYSLRESGVISHALDIVRSNVQVQPATAQVAETPATVHEKTATPTIET